MLEFFRRYQRIFFIFTTVVIVISFSFFGTYDSMVSQPTQKDEVVLKTPQGKGVYRSELQNMAVFLQSDMVDKVNNRGAWGFNFLNDGVIRADFLETGIAKQLITQFREELRGDFGGNSRSESMYQPYSHPQARFISAEMIWSTFSPKLKEQFDRLRRAEDPLSDEAIDARIQLYLAQQQFPPDALRQILRFQEQQYDWVRPDPALNSYDLHLFGYRNEEDWFGRRFLHLAGQLIVNAASMAEQQGYKVTEAEAMADLVRSTELSFQQNSQSPYLGVTNSGEYYREQLRRMNMTESDAVHIWRQVLLFRRLFQDTDQSVLVDGHSYRRLHGYARAGVEADVYELPSELQLNRFEDLQQLEVYLDLTTNRSGWDSDSPLSMPTTFLSVDELEKSAPELVEREYRCDVAEVDKESLQTKVGIRDMWAWQRQNWEVLKTEFPKLHSISDESNVLEAIESLDDQTRRKVDAFARAAIVAQHPEWLDEALSAAQGRPMDLGLRRRGGSLPIAGEVDREQLISLLDAESSPELKKYTANDRHYYRIEVLERPEKPKVLTFVEARRDGTLEELALAKLEQHYEKIRGGNVRMYRDSEGEWKPLREVRDEVAKSLFAGILRYVEDEFAEQNPGQESKDTASPDRLASYRMYEHMRLMREQIVANPEAQIAMDRDLYQEGSSDNTERLTKQWRLKKRTVSVRRDEKSPFDLEQMVAMQPGSWSAVQDDVAGEIKFYQVRTKLATETNVGEHMDSAQAILGREAQQVLMAELLDQLGSAQNLTLDYLKLQERG